MQLLLAHAVARLYSFVDEIKICSDGQTIYQHSDHVPCDHWPRRNQQTVIYPQDLKHARDRRHSRFDASAGAMPEHSDQVGHGGKSRSEASKKPEEF